MQDIDPVPGTEVPELDFALPASSFKGRRNDLFGKPAPPLRRQVVWNRGSERSLQILQADQTAARRIEIKGATFQRRHANEVRGMLNQHGELSAFFLGTLPVTKVPCRPED